MRSGRDRQPTRQPTPAVLPGDPCRVVTCAQCREVVLEADQIGDEEECRLRDHLWSSTRTRFSPSRSMLLRYFVVTEGPPPAA